MKATETRLLPFLKKSNQFRIPVYQRTYSWKKGECEQLWDDIMRAGKDEEVRGHFLGSIVYIEGGIFQITDQDALLVIDGQQRLATAMLIIEALARRVGEQEIVPGFTARKLRNYYLLNDLETDDRRFKLLLTRTDKESLIALLEQRSVVGEESHRIKESFEYFEKQIKSLGQAHIRSLCRGLEKLIIVDIALNRDQDNPQLIFESMNSTGRELTQADLVRNYVLMGLPHAEQSELYKLHWRPMEIAFGQQAYSEQFDRFLRHYLTAKTGEVPKLRAVYEALKEYAQKYHNGERGIHSLVADLHKHAGYYCAMALGQEKDKSLRQVFQDLRELKVDVAYPVLLVLYHNYKEGLLSKELLCDAARLLESYTFRRAICELGAYSQLKTLAALTRVLMEGSKSNTFKELTRNLDEVSLLDVMKAEFANMRTYRRFPKDEEFCKLIKEKDLYNFNRAAYFLRHLENFNHKEKISIDDYTIEHIMPQNPNLPLAWQTELGEDWEKIQETYLHTLGNLTLTGYNAELSDRPFREKRDSEGGYKSSHLKLNKELGGVLKWDKIAIENRAERLANIAAKVWKDIDHSKYSTTTPASHPTDAYTIEDHPQLSSGKPARPLFDALAKEVLALDPSVRIVYVKSYIACKADGNFVEIMPLKSSLKLYLNLPFHELIDSRGLARDVTDVARTCSGPVEVRLTDISELHQVMHLIRQAFEWQMGDGDGDLWA